MCDIKEKQCSRCKEFKLLEDFHKKGGSNKGLSSHCKMCRNSKTRERSVLYKELEKILPENGLKTCCTCKIEKSITDFSKKSDTKDGLMRRCKQCVSEHHQKTKEITSIRAKKYYEDNKLVINTYKNNWIKNKRESDVLYKLIVNIRSNVKSSIKSKKSNKNNTTLEILNCTIEEFKLHIESQFLSWMTWDNYGNVCGTELQYNCSWDLDHIIPTSYAINEEEVYLLNHWSNFQPLCSKMNRDIKKANFYPCTNLELGVTFLKNRLEN